MKPAGYLESVKDLLLADFRISRYQIVREFVEADKAYIRVRVTLMDGSLLEFSEYIERFSEDEIQITDYSYHWQDKKGKFLRCWDNATHYPSLENFPHHIHILSGAIEDVTPGIPTNIFAILDEIAKIIGQE